MLVLLGKNLHFCDSARIAFALCTRQRRYVATLNTPHRRQTTRTVQKLAPSGPRDPLGPEDLLGPPGSQTLIGYFHKVHNYHNYI